MNLNSALFDESYGFSNIPQENINLYSWEDASLISYIDLPFFDENEQDRISIIENETDNDNGDAKLYEYKSKEDINLSPINIFIENFRKKVLNKYGFNPDLMIRFHPHENYSLLKVNELPNFKEVENSLITILFWDSNSEMPTTAILLDRANEPPLIEFPSATTNSPNNSENTLNNLILDSEKIINENRENSTKAVPIKRNKKSVTRRNPTIELLIELVYKWRSISDSSKNKSLKRTSKLFNIPKKTLDDYYLQIKDGYKYGFDFEANRNNTISCLRKYVKEHTLSPRKYIRKHKKNN